LGLFLPLDLILQQVVFFYLLVQHDRDLVDFGFKLGIFGNKFFFVLFQTEEFGTLFKTTFLGRLPIQHETFFS